MTVLIVEDEPLIRLLASDMIEDAGWRAVEAANSSEAVELFQGNIEIDVLFTDINMPGDMDGLQLAEWVHDHHPAVRLVVTSGKRALPHFIMPDSGTFLPKPYGFDDLVSVIRSKIAE